MSEIRSVQSYTPEEILSFDRIKRAMTSRVLDQIEILWQGKEPINAEVIGKIITAEWQKVKETVRSSPAAREAFRKYLERTVAEQIDKIMKDGKSELESLGVAEKSL